jgi:hypothetical protein
MARTRNTEEIATASLETEQPLEQTPPTQEVSMKKDTSTSELAQKASSVLGIEPSKFKASEEDGQEIVKLGEFKLKLFGAQLMTFEVGPWGWQPMNTLEDFCAYHGIKAEDFNPPA